MAWDEWEQLKAQAAERHTSHTRLNSASADGSGGTGTLKHKGGPWTKAAGTADELQTSTVTSGVDLRAAHDGISGSLEGLVSLSTLKTVLTSWDERLSAVRDECGDLEPKLRQVAKDMGEVDAAAADKTKSVQVPDTRKAE
ncbi:amino acid ABC transporter permease [Streptomyces roseirectus]|uniref:Amino acid ABC transporter permease n=1 Tax=Streptomyces roseirectus TaxID=2768066 RepID=A0A7H0IE80_9ACTN|nr:amino acid ABC transporter permease [Streptomyces roseirectus]QNP71096.1 amino acid ABC transporter permease [Streptomyces roseirectus]